MTAIAVLLLGLLAGEDFKDVRIEKAYKPYLEGSPLLMETTGAKVIRLKNGNRVVLGVGATVLDDDGSRTRLDAEKVCKAKALASIVAEREGVQVAHEEKLKDRTVIVVENGVEKGKNVSDLLSITRTKTKGLVKGMAVVGRWRSADGKVLYVALGAVCKPNGDPFEE